MLKRLLGVSVLIFTVSSTVLGQSFGVKIGRSFASQDWKTIGGMSNISTDSRSGMIVGVFTEVISLPLIGLVAEADYTQKGTKTKVPVTTTGDPAGTTGQMMTLDNRVDYLSFALFARLKFGGLLFSPYLFGGPRLDVYLTNTAGESLVSIYDQFKKQISGVSVGIGAEILDILPVNLLIELQYNHDLTFAYESELYEIRNRSVDMKIGVKF